MSLSAPGVGSGLDVKAMVEALVKAEITPIQVRQDKRLLSVNTELSAVGQLKSTLATLQTTLTKLSDIKQFYNMKFSVSDTDYFSTTVSPQAVKGTYQLEVKQLAQQHTLASDYLTNTGSGTLTIDFGTYENNNTTFTPNASATSVSVTIAPGSDSLVAVRDAINNKNAGVTASIVKDSQGSRLTIASSKTGENYAMKISGDITALNYDATAPSNVMSETIAAQDSIVKINGLTLKQNTNQLEEAIAGVTINLKKAAGTNETKIITLTVDDNKEQLTGLINDFIKQYNDSMTFLTNLTGYNPETKQSGVFQGDPQFRSLKLNLNKWATSPLATNSPIKSLADLGIVTNKQTGLLEVKQDQYKKALDNNYANIGALFAKTASATDSDIRVKSVGANVKAGSYNVELSQFTPGVSMSGTIGGASATSPDGLVLTGSGELGGLSINVLSGTAGSRGQITVNDGIAVQMNSFLDNYMKTKGDLDQRATQLDRQMKMLGRDQEALDLRSKKIEARYLAQFTALDTLISSLQNTSGFLTQQLANLPQFKSK
jgi:flagellar hook-associated protein 2